MKIQVERSGWLGGKAWACAMALCMPFALWGAELKCGTPGTRTDGSQAKCSAGGYGDAMGSGVAESVSKNGTALLTLEFTPRDEDAGSEKGSVALEVAFGARVSKERLGSKEDAWVMVELPGYVVSQGKPIAVQWDTGLPKAALIEYGVEVYFAYRTVDGGKPANPFLHPWKLGAYPGASALAWVAK